MPTDNILWTPPLLPKDQKRFNERQEHRWSKVVKWIGLSDKTLLDILSVLLVPIVIAAATIWFSVQQGQASTQASEQQHQTDLRIAQDQQRETTLKTYLDNMSDLLLNHHLSQSRLGDEVSELARERTLTTLRTLDAIRNGIVLQFLQDANLIGVKNAVVDLSRTNLSGVNLSNTNLSNTNLSGAILSNTNLSNTNLSGAILSGATLNNSNLSNADLSNANLSRAVLSNSNLSNADLSAAILSNSNLSNADLSNADLSAAILSNSNLSGVNLSNTRVSPNTHSCTVTSPNGLDVLAAPTSKSAIIAWYPPGTVLNFIDIVQGEAVDGNPLWGHSQEGHYFSLGGTDHPNG